MQSVTTMGTAYDAGRLQTGRGAIPAAKNCWRRARACGRLLLMGSIIWDREVAEVYDQTYRARFEPSLLGPVMDLLAGLAGGGPAFEFAVGTGWVALPLSARGVAVHALELSPTWQRSSTPSPAPVPVPSRRPSAT